MEKTSDNGQTEQCSSQVDPEKAQALEGWTKAEKFDLLQGLKTYGSYEISDLLSLVPNKSKEQIRNAIDYYKAKALSISQYTTIRKGNKNHLANSHSVPLSSWAKVLTDVYNYDELQTETATALRLIAEFEDIPHPVCTEYVDFRKAYHMLANAMEGKALQEDKLLVLLMNKCILEAAFIGRTFIKKSTLRNMIENIDLSDKEIKLFIKPAADNDEAIILHLSSQKNYNPLKLTDEYLRLKV